MKSHWIGPVRRSRCEHPRQRTAGIRTRMDLHHVAPGAVQPGHHDKVVAGCKPVQRRGREWKDFEPGIGGALPTLLRRVTATLESGSDHPNGTNLSCHLLTLSIAENRHVELLKAFG